MGALRLIWKLIPHVVACCLGPESPDRMQYYIRGAWRTISDHQTSSQTRESRAENQDQHRFDNATTRQPPRSIIPPKVATPSTSGKNRGSVKRELSEEMKQSSAFLRDTEGEWEAILRRMSSRGPPEAGNGSKTEDNSQSTDASGARSQP